TDDPALLATAVRRTLAGGGTRLYDALHFVIESKLAGPEVRKVVIVITDGDDKSSRHSPKDVIDVALRNGVSVYSVSVNALGILPSSSPQSDSVLDMLSSETGGAAFFPKKVERFSAIFTKISDELRAQYAIGYRSTNEK